MAEEHGFQAPEGHRLCANNCGFFGSPATLNLCSKCYRDSHLKQQNDALAKAALDSTSPGPSPSPIKGPSAHHAEVKLSGPINLESLAVEAVASTAEVQARPEPGPVMAVQIGQSQPNRCLTCRKRVGLTGFKCRCGLVYCGTHRYPEQHGCTFDYKTAGKEEIAKANPLIKAEKLEKI